MFSPFEMPPCVPPELFVRVRMRPSIVIKGIVVLRAGANHTAEAGTDLEAHRRWEGHHRFCQICLELVEHRFTESNREHFVIPIR